MLNYGHLIGEVIRRITGQRLGEFFARHLAGPLGADFHIGLPPSEFHRVTNVVPPPLPVDPTPFDPTHLDANSVASKTWTNPAMPGPQYSWTEGWRRADSLQSHDWFSAGTCREIDIAATGSLI